MSFPGSSAGKESICNAGDLGSIPGLGRSPGGSKGYPLQCSGLENAMDCTYSSWGRRQSDMTEGVALLLFHFHTLGIRYIYIAYILGICPPYPQDILSKTSSGCLKPWIVPNPLCVFSCMSTPMIKFQS